MFAVVLLATTLSGCATFGNVEPMARQLPDACESLARPVALPPVVAKDLGVLAAENRSAAVKANGRLTATHGCLIDERKAYAK